MRSPQFQTPKLQLNPGIRYHFCIRNKEAIAINTEECVFCMIVWKVKNISFVCSFHASVNDPDKGIINCPSFTLMKGCASVSGRILNTNGNVAIANTFMLWAWKLSSICHRISFFCFHFLPRKLKIYSKGGKNGLRARDSK